MVNISHLLEQLSLEEQETSRTLHLTANENCLSRTARSFLHGDAGARYLLGSDLDRISDGIVTEFGQLAYRAMPALEQLEREAHKVARRMFESNVVDCRPLSGMHAVISVIASLSQPGDTVFSLPPDRSGHVATSTIVERLGRRSAFLPWNDDHFDLDIDKITVEFGLNRPSLIFLDFNSPFFALSLGDLRRIAGPTVRIAYDASHVAGLIAGGVFQKPLLEGADVLQGNTHKSFPGPQKAMIHCGSRETGRSISRYLSAGLVSSQHTHETIALYITMLEMAEFGRDYASQLLRNSAALACSLHESGFTVLRRGDSFPTTHLVAFFATDNVEARLWAQKLICCGISVNARPLFGRPAIRLGVQESTRRGLKVEEMRYVAELLTRAIRSNDEVRIIRSKVEDLVSSFPAIGYCFDEPATRVQG
jgi:glycine hydroxymethyltransferase